MADFNLIKLDAKPIVKLIEVISEGIGTLYKPRAIRKEADATAYEIEVIERAKSKALAEGKERQAETDNLIQNRLLNTERRRQNSIDCVAEIAAEELENEQIVTDEPVNKDWSTRFFNIVQDVSDEEMQQIWGRILAGEVRKPKSYSLRTLEVLKNLSNDEANTFVKIACLYLSAEKKKFIFNPDQGKFIDNNFNIKFPDILKLKESGLLVTESNLELTFIAPTEADTRVIEYNNKGLIIERALGAPKQTLPVLIFTSAGVDLLQLINPSIELKYIYRIKQHLTNDKVVVKMGDIIHQKDGTKIVTNFDDIAES